MLERSGPRLRAGLIDKREWARWRRRQWDAPSPPSVKRCVLARHHVPGATWVETGTYRGDTTEYLARLSGSVISIEPDVSLHQRASIRFANDPRIRLVRGTSEEVFEGVVNSLTGPVCFWLDGHFSGPGTYEGPATTPILQELDCIAARIPHFSALAVLVDDFREFGSSAETRDDAGYPSRDTLVDWARDCGLSWAVEHDILVAVLRGPDVTP